MKLINNMNIKFKKLHPDAVIPTKAHPTDAGFDLTAVSKEYDKHGALVFGTGLAMEIPVGYVGLVFPRSSIAEYDVALSNAVGVIDSGYRGEIMAKFKPTTYYAKNRDSLSPLKSYKVGERIAQLIIMPVPSVEFTEVDSLSESERGTGGYGSSGK